MGILHQLPSLPFPMPLCLFTCASTSAVDSSLLPLLFAHPSLTCQASGSPHPQRNALESSQAISHLSLRSFPRTINSFIASVSLILIRSGPQHRCIVPLSARTAAVAGSAIPRSYPPCISAALPLLASHFQRASRHSLSALLLFLPCRLLRFSCSHRTCSSDLRPAALASSAAPWSLSILWRRAHSQVLPPSYHPLLILC